MSSAQMVTLMLDLAIILAVARALGALAQRLDQPPVIGEILAGILVGPTLFHGVIAKTLFPVDVRPMLSALANLGVVLFMFLVGLEFDRKLLRARLGSIAMVMAGSTLVPFGLGMLLATWLASRYSGGHGFAFVLYLGTAMSVTAFPVLARIVSDRGMSGTRVGGFALGSAALGDLLAWSMLAFAIIVAGGGSGHTQWRVLLVVPLVVVSFLLLRPLLDRLARGRAGRAATPGAFAVVIAGLLAWSALTEWMGLHFIFGAFLFGLVMPRAEAEGLAKNITQQVEQVCTVLLLPAYFVIAGLQVDLSTIGVTGLGIFGLIMVAAVGGKFAGALAGSRAARLDWRHSTAVAMLMNTRGLTELIVLSTGLQLSLINGELYSLMVLMAVVTTAMAGPLLRLIYPRRQLTLDLEHELAQSVAAR